jgi:hypothetical protein
MFSPAQVSTNPPAMVAWRGGMVAVANAGRAIAELQLTPAEAQEFLLAVHRVAPDLVSRNGGGFSVSRAMASAWVTALVKRWKSEEPFVSVEEANRRAQVCANCPMHVAMSGCRSCGTVNEWLMAVPEGLVHDLGACGACGCHLPTKVWLAKEVIASDSRDISYPSNCWVLEA